MQAFCNTCSDFHMEKIGLSKVFSVGLEQSLQIIP